MARVTQEIAVQRIKRIFGDDLDLSKFKYIKANVHATVKCNKCGKEFSIRPSHLFDGHGCYDCAHKRIGIQQRKTTEQFIQEYTNKFGDIYDLSKVKYVTELTPIIVICKKHGEFITTPKNLLQGNGCPKCTNKTQYSIYKELTSTFPDIEILYDCKVSWLEGQHFDMYIPKFNIAIEYNGEQHYMLISKFGGELKFKEVQRRDKLKEEKCIRNNCTLFIIPYNNISNNLLQIKSYITNLI